MTTRDKVRGGRGARNAICRLLPRAARACLLALAAPAVLHSRADSLPATASSTTSAVASNPVSGVIRSARRGFSVYAADFTLKQRTADWADEMASRLERLLGMRLDVPDRVLRIERLTVPAERGAALRAQQWYGGQLWQSLWIPESGPEGGERTLEDYVWLLLSALVADRQRAAGIGGPPRGVPEWLSVGMAQSLLPELRARNNRLALDLFRSGMWPALAEVLAWEYVSVGPGSHRAVCALAADWVAAESVPRYGGWAAILARRARDLPVTSDWLAAAAMGGGDAVALERRWGEWARRRERVVTDFGALSSGLMSELAKQLPVRTADGREIAPADLVAQRRDPAVRRAVVVKAGALRAMAIGKAPEFAEAVNAYCRFYDALTSRKWGAIVRRRLAAAEALRARLASELLASEAYMDRWERAMDARRAGQAAAEQPALEPTAAERAYVDEWERRRAGARDAGGVEHGADGGAE